MKRALIITGGSFELNFAEKFLENNKFDKIIAVDGGLKYVDQLALQPDYIVGDLDTISPTLVKKYQKIPYIIWKKYRKEKDETDTELARDCALELECKEIAILGALGGRMDHTLGNIHILKKCMESDVFAYLLDQQNKIYLIGDSHTIEKCKMWGPYISLFPYSDQVESVTLEGFKYPLKDKIIKKGEEASRYLSNEIEASQGLIKFEAGILICIESND